MINSHYMVDFRSDNQKAFEAKKESKTKRKANREAMRRIKRLAELKAKQAA